MTYKIFSLGCKVNSYECNALSSLLKKEGFLECKDDNPDVVIINTCSVTQTADQKSRQHIRKFKKLYPNACVVVMGCYAQGNKEYIKNNLQPTILIGTSNRNKIPNLVNEYFRTHQNIVEVNDDVFHFEYEDFGITSFTERVRAFLKIQDGCSNFCSYCIVPYRRGRSRSRPFDSVINEAQQLVSDGYSEIVLTGIHIGGYGQDLKDVNFSDLVEALLKIDGLKRLRISSIEESEIDDKLIELYRTNNNLARHMHIPLQSGSSTVLSRMYRKHNAARFLEKIKKIKEADPHIMLSTDVIVGFPGETEEEFKETINFINECDFNQLHVFPFSAREGTKAASMPNQIDPKIKKERANTLLNLSKQMWNKYLESCMGSEEQVLVESFANGMNIGHTSNYIEISIPSNEGRINEFVNIKIDKNTIISK